jgi:hypothetical protein
MRDRRELVIVGLGLVLLVATSPNTTRVVFSELLPLQYVHLSETSARADQVVRVELSSQSERETVFPGSCTASLDVILHPYSEGRSVVYFAFQDEAFGENLPDQMVDLEPIADEPEGDTGGAGDTGIETDSGGEDEPVDSEEESFVRILSPSLVAVEFSANRETRRFEERITFNVDCDETQILNFLVYGTSESPLDIELDWSLAYEADWGQWTDDSGPISLGCGDSDLPRWKLELEDRGEAY